MSDEGSGTHTERLPADEENGPYFPSGMNSVEAALSGATGGMTEEEKAKVLEGGTAAPSEE